MNKLTREYKQLATQNGFILVRIRKHMIFKHPTGALVSCPATPSDSRRGLKQFQADIRKALSQGPTHDSD
jgi:predicted RNA binding protein YcfA (HicA-like mRNA interferase family)